MSVRIMSLVWELELPDSEKLVLLALADCANDEGLCWPGMATLKRKCTKSDRTIQLSIKMLVAKGHLTRDETPGKGCKYIVHPIVRFASDPRSDNAPEAITPRSHFGSPPKPLRVTPEATSGKPSKNHQEPPKDLSAQPTPLTKQEVLDAWEQRMVPRGFPRIAKMTGARERQLAARLKDSTIEEWQRAMDALERSAFCRGENDRGWRADFDFLLQPKSFTKLLEGAYDH